MEHEKRSVTVEWQIVLTLTCVLPGQTRQLGFMNKSVVILACLLNNFFFRWDEL